MSPAEIEKWVSDAATAFAAAGDLDSLKSARLAHLGDKAPISLASRGLGSLAPEEKASAGKLIGEAKAAIAASLEKATEKLEAERDAKVLLEEVVDITLPVNRAHRGGLHPITIIKNEISDFFIEQGYAVEEGPELESGWLNFDALNIPADHPARTMQDTFYIEPVDSGMVLRTQTSPVQIRSMLEHQPPIYMICPGRTFRADELDATHSRYSTKSKAWSLIKASPWRTLRGLSITLLKRCSVPMSQRVCAHPSSHLLSQVQK